jgi:hypothetical protein
MSYSTTPTLYNCTRYTVTRVEMKRFVLHCYKYFRELFFYFHEKAVKILYNTVPVLRQMYTHILTRTSNF